MTLARYHARQVIKRRLYAQGIKLAHVESREITIAANKYIEAHGRLMLTVLGGLAEFERELIRARTDEGRKRAQARRVRLEGTKTNATSNHGGATAERSERGIS
ncbi:MAG: recombinase family protein [Pseudolabrys sp.]